MASRTSDRVDAPRSRTRSMRWSALPRLLELAPPRVLLLVGIVIAGLGALIVIRPLTSVVLLGVYVGVSAIVSGIIDLVSQRRTPRWWTTAFALLWIGGGAAVLIWLGRSLDLLPVALAVLLIVGGLASLGDAVVGGRVSERVLAAAWGGAQILFGILSLTWPDVTLLVVAVVFGVRTIVFGVSLVVRGGRGMRRAHAEARGRASSDRAPQRGAIIAAAIGRYALAAVLVVVAAGGWWLNDWLAEGAPVVDAFYDPPAEVPAAHGSLLRTDSYNGRAPRYGTAQRILYTTQDALGQPAVASALVITPKKPAAGPRPVVIWNHGTTGVARGCAPSLRDASATKWAIPGLDDALSRGWVVVASDYSGQGAPGVFPYLIGPGEAHSSLDAVLAAQEMPDLNLSDDVVVWGHSQGGHAALWTAQLAGEYTPQLNIAGTAAIAPVADPRALARELTHGGGTRAGGAALSVMISWVLVPYADTYSDVNVPTYVAPGARSLVREMTQRCLSEPGVIVSMLTALGVSEDQPLYPADLTDGPLGARLAQNAATGPFPSPVLVAWGSADEVIPTTLQTRFVDDQCAAGAAVRGVEYEGYNHLRTIMPGSTFLPVLMRWTAARLDGQPAPPMDCG